MLFEGKILGAHSECDPRATIARSRDDLVYSWVWPAAKGHVPPTVMLFKTAALYKVPYYLVTYMEVIP